MSFLDPWNIALNYIGNRNLKLSNFAGMGVAILNIHDALWYHKDCIEYVNLEQMTDAQVFKISEIFDCFYDG